jgi:hypothetical protein
VRDSETFERPEIAREAIYLRGLFIHRHAGVEYAVNELLVRARLLQPYQSIGNLPYPFGRRLRLVEHMMSMPGPLSRFRGVFEDAVRASREYTEPRSFIVHGLMNVPASNTDTLKFSVYVHSGGLHRLTAELSLSELAELTDRLFDLSSVIPPLVARIIEEVPLPQVEQGPAQRLRRKPSTSGGG